MSQLPTANYSPRRCKGFCFYTSRVQGTALSQSFVLYCVRFYAALAHVWTEPYSQLLPYLPWFIPAIRQSRQRYTALLGFQTNRALFDFLTISALIYG